DVCSSDLASGSRAGGRASGPAGTPRRECCQRRARSRAGSTFSRQVRLGQVGSGAAQDLVLLLQQPVPAAELAQFRGVLTGLAGTVAVVDVCLADPFVERHLVDAEVLRDLRDRDAVLARPGHSHDVFAELLRVGSGHGAHPSRPPYGQARSDVTYSRGSPPRSSGTRYAVDPAIASARGSTASTLVCSASRLCRPAALAARACSAVTSPAAAMICRGSVAGSSRSEERRVGKGGGGGWARARARG